MLAKFIQIYAPYGPFWSTVVAALPIVTLLYLVAVHPHKDRDGRQHYGIAAPWAAFWAVVVAMLVSIVEVRMPAATAISAWANGAAFGMIGIGWIVVAAMFLYTMTLITGKFEILKHSVMSLSADRRIQAILIAFCFGAFIEGAAGFGTPVAIAGAMMVALGFDPISAAVLNLVANTAPVAFGAVGTPIVTLAGLTGIPKETISAMAGRQLPIFSLIIPLWMVATMVFMNKGKWKDVWAVLPAMLVAGLSFGITQFFVSNYIGPELTDILAGLISMLCLALFMLVWQPAETFRLPGDEQAAARVVPGFGGAMAAKAPKYSTAEQVKAWIPWGILTLFVYLWGDPHIKPLLAKTNVVFKNWPALTGIVFRSAPVGTGKAAEGANFVLNWLAAPGTGVFLAAVVTGLYLGLSGQQWGHAIVRTAQRMKKPLITIGLVLGLGSITKFSGTDAILGLAFTHTGFLYPFFAPLLGWLGVFLAGSDTASNALFGSLQQITAQQLGLNPVLIVASNSTGGVMGKMIDPQSIVVATAACYEDRKEGDAAFGVIWRKVVVHSIVLACLMGVLVMIQAYVWTSIVPK